MLFKELIDLLKKVKTQKDINEQVAQEVSAAAAAIQMSLYVQEPDIDPREALNMARMSILALFDEILLDIELDEDMDEDIPMFPGEHPDSPMSDPIFKQDMDRAIEAYNKRVTKGK